MLRINWECTVMQVIKTLILIAAGIMLSGQQPAFAQERIPITLEEARQRALAHNPSLQQAELDVRAARWGMLGAVSDALPNVSFNSSVLRSDDATVDRQNITRDVILQEYGQYIDPEDFPPFAYKDMYSSSISVDQPIYNGGVELTAMRIAGTRKKLIKLNRALQNREAMLAVETAYYNFCRAFRSMEIQQNVLAVSRGYAERMQRRAEQGMVSNVEVLRWEVRASEDEAALVEAQNNLRLAELSLEQTMGTSTYQQYIPADINEIAAQAEPLINSGPGSVEDLWQEMQENSLDLDIIHQNVKLEGHNVWLASSNFQPRLNFNYTYAWQADDDWQLDGFESWTAAISLSIPLFSSFGNVARFQEARVNYKRAQVGAKDYETGLYIQLNMAHNNLLSATARLQTALKMADQAGQVLDSQENRYDLGIITMLELLDAQNADQAAQLNVINAGFDALIARAQLKRLTGE